MPNCFATGLASAAVRRIPATAYDGAIHLPRHPPLPAAFRHQLLGAFNDNLFKNAMVLFVVYQVYNDEPSENWFSAITTGVFILPFFLLSALSGQLADSATRRRSSASSKSARS
jgi:hypothetical protein